MAWFSRRIVALVLALAAVQPAIAANGKLPAYNAAPNRSSISGISSGAFMAVQFATAWSSLIMGIGVIAGGPFGCSDGSSSTAQSTCMIGIPAPNLSELIRHTDTFSQSGAIDPVTNIVRQKVYLFSGYNDTEVARTVVDSLRAFYAHYLGANLANLFYQTAIGAGHAQVTLTYGDSCAENGGEYINKCGYDQAGIMLQHIYGALMPPNRGTLGGTILTFSQAEFTAPDQPNDDSMDDNGFAYVPADCTGGQACAVHVALHGCLQSVGMVQQDFVRHAGYNEWADNNRIIVLYPQTHVLPLNAYGVANPKACWDWWGYLDADPTEHPTYLLKTGKQITAIKRMIDRLTGGAQVSGGPSSGGPSGLPNAVLAPDRSDTAADLVWSPILGAAGYAVFRADSSSQPFHQIGTITGLSYADSGLRPATTYRYAVAAAGTSLPPDAPAVTVVTLRKVSKCVDPGQCAVH
jgi:poly(3-hydroxybutyrate) depolymerase